MQRRVRGRDAGTSQSLGRLLEKVKTSRVLLVGAGGIGCELLKNLVTSGFGSGPSKDVSNDNGNANDVSTTAAAAEQSSNTESKQPGIVIVDLDTIDLSNLNRQFLFRKQHLKKPKAFVAKETASHFNPSVNIDAHHASIFDGTYTVEFFESFDIVFNALDNVAARRRVNKMCLAANTPLIESGTTGFNGQVQAIQKGITACYDCSEKPVQKSYPICTIRSTPSQPIHCIVWAKSYLLPELFGASESEDSSNMAVTDGDDAEEVAKLKEEAEALKKVRGLLGQAKFAQEAFNKVFHDDIKRLQSMSEMWQNRKAPELLRFESLAIDPDAIKQGQALSLLDQRVWGLLDNFKVFCYSIDALANRVQASEGDVEFDKDDKDTLDFVASAANLRAHVFGIPLNSEWDIKQMAGNIIPAIATANALTASLCVLESFKLFRAQEAATNAAAMAGNIAQAGQTPQSTPGPQATPAPQTTPAPQSKPQSNGRTAAAHSKMVFLESKSTERMIGSYSLERREACPVCSPVYAKIVLPTDGSPTIQHLVDLLTTRLGYSDLSITTEAGLIFDPDLDENLPKPLHEFGIHPDSNTFITITDDGDDPRVDLILSVAVTAAEDLNLRPEKFDLPPKPKAAPAETNGHTNGDNGPVTISSPGPGEKRKREAEDDVDDMAKKRTKGDATNTIHEIQDDGPIDLD